MPRKSCPGPDPRCSGFAITTCIKKPRGLPARLFYWLVDPLLGPEAGDRQELDGIAGEPVGVGQSDRPPGSPRYRLRLGACARYCRRSAAPSLRWRRWRHSRRCSTPSAPPSARRRSPRTWDQASGHGRLPWLPCGWSSHPCRSPRPDRSQPGGQKQPRAAMRHCPSPAHRRPSLAGRAKRPGIRRLR